MTNGYIIRGRIVQDVFNPVLKDHAVVVEDGSIIEIGPFERIRKDYSYTIYGDRNSIVIPGFVNTHSHAVQTFFRGAADDRELLDWLQEVILPGEATLNAEEAYSSSLIGYAEMLYSGITTTNDMATVHHADKTIKAAWDSGIRAHVGKMLMDRNAPSGLLQETEEAIKEANYLASQNPKGGRVQYAYTPRFIITCSEELMKRAKEEATARGLIYHTHAAENLEECRTVKTMTGNDYIKAHQELKVLGKGTILAHCVWVDDKDISLIKQSGTSISHNPSSNGKLASGISPVPKFLTATIDVGLATDGSPATGGHDMFLEMKLASYYQKASTNDPKIMDAKTVFHLATLGGAKALGMENEIGSIKVGKKADIVVLNPTFPNSYPLYNEFSYVVYSATKREVQHVFCDGKLLISNGKFHMDLSSAFQEAEVYAEKMPWKKRITISS
ncbi:MAG: N-ethylammeline chlorohydrolase [Methanobacteriota archaeon]|nr:MAG: N-ethylammeline chlorohydrolase [Euryarchaeota archaeon]